MSDPAATAKRVVIADDTAFVRDRFADALKTAGHETFTASTAAELLEQVERHREDIDLLVIDLKLPRARGVELVRTIRHLDRVRASIVVFSGTIGSADEVRQLATLGVAGYVNEYSAPHHILPALAPHLFPDSFNRRTSPRVVLGIPVSYRFGQTIAAAVTLNVSKGGLAIRTLTPPAVGSLLKVRFRLPGSKRDIEADGRIAWNDQRVGMGLQFEHIDAADQSAINEYVDLHFFSNRRG